MITEQEKHTLDKFKREWKNFKKCRAKKNCDFSTRDGWLSILDREKILDYFMEIFDKVDFDQFCHL